MRIAICDDDGKDLRQMQELLAQCAPDLSIRSFSSAQALYESGDTFDAVLLDIEMEAPNGYEIALRLARQEQHPIILFVTNSAAYAIQGYGLALRYLLKPLTREILSEALDAVKAELNRSRLTVSIDGVTHVLQVQQIRFAEVSGHRVTLHTGGEKLSFRATMKDIGALLPVKWFCAPHQSYIVNLLHVRSVSKDTVFLDDGTAVPLSRRRQGEFLQAFHTFLGVGTW